MGTSTTRPSRRIALHAVLAAAILALGLADFRTGPHISILILYLIPVVLASLQLSTRDGLRYSLLAGVVWFIANGASAAAQALPLRLWNGLVRTAIFVFVVYVIHLQKRMRELLLLERNLRRTDHLTGILNRSGFIDESRRIADLCARHGRHLSLAFIDLDGFKHINDSRGHREGDELLKAFASILGANLRASDFLARFGGDEFVILFPETPLASASSALEKVRHAFSALAGQKKWPVTFSAGLVACRGPRLSVEYLLVMADRQLYAAKHAGKNRIVGLDLTATEPAGKAPERGA